ncbi:acyltransferase family protein [Synechococcus sp. UW140]|uniref:acyltransferase family protein n=1 Tax=Synechococcus sp. UW140 TaxID=368503 RepID=UPI0031382C88
MTSKYRPEIDGLRAFAVVAVIINHFNKDLLPSGYLGVDIFFVISGYVITSSLAVRESKNFLDFLSGFYERRIKRLVPALVVFVLITSVLISLFNPDPGVALKTGITSLFGLSNLYLFKTSTDYFAQSTELNPFVHTWSLGVEEQFYLLFPFLIWFSGFGQQTAKGARNLFFWVGTLTIASLIGFIYLYQVNQPAAYFLMPTRLWEMAAGCLVFIGFLKRARIEQALEKIPPLLVVAAMVGVMYLPVAAAVPATIGIVVMSAVLIACLKRGTVAYKFFTLEKVVYVGLISYSLYLWHWTVLSISRWTIGIHWWSVPIQIALIILLAFASYRLVEVPIRRGGLHPKRSLNIFSGAIAVVVSAVFLKVVSSYHNHLYSGVPERGEQFYSEKDRWNHKLCVSDRRSDAVPTFLDFTECYLGTRKKSNPGNLVPTIFWYGNSFNEQLMPAAARIQLRSGLQMNSFAVSGCPATLNMEYADEKVPGFCAKTFRKYINFVLESGASGSKLIVAASPGYWSGLSGDESVLRQKGSVLTIEKAQEFYKEELIRLSGILAKNGKRLVVATGIPALTSNPDICSNIGSYFNETCKVALDATALKSNEALVSVLKSANAQSNYFQVLDIYSPLANKIRNERQDIFSFYYNSEHISKKGALFLIPTLSAAIRD